LIYVLPQTYFTATELDDAEKKSMPIIFPRKVSIAILPAIYYMAPQTTLAADISAGNGSKEKVKL
jgi:hypothetical protein